jgi:hypothetical protein
MIAIPSAPSPLGRLARRVPVVGRVIREMEREADTVYYLITIFVTAVVLAVQTWGLPALVLTALAMVPVMFVVLITLARP